MDEPLEDGHPSGGSSIADLLDRPRFELGYDVIVGARCVDQLERLLLALGEQPDATVGRARRPRAAVFLGCLVDEVGEETSCADLVRGLVDAGSAVVALGPHEVALLQRHSSDRPRSRSTTGSSRHGPTEWLLTVPLWLDLPRLRVVHAAWHHTAIARLQTALGGNVLVDLDAVRRISLDPRLRRALETIMRGDRCGVAEPGWNTPAGSPLVVTAHRLGMDHPSAPSVIAYRHDGGRTLDLTRVVRVS